MALHAVLHLAKSSPQPMKSEELAGCIHTNPVVIRRILGKLRETGFVRSEKGHGGGWTLVKQAKEISIQDICSALDETLLPAYEYEEESEQCLIILSVGGIMRDFLQDSQALLASRLSRISLADFLVDVEKRG